MKIWQVLRRTKKQQQMVPGVKLWYGTAERSKPLNLCLDLVISETHSQPLDRHSSLRMALLVSLHKDWSRALELHCLPLLSFFFYASSVFSMYLSWNWHCGPSSRLCECHIECFWWLKLTTSATKVYDISIWLYCSKMELGLFFIQCGKDRGHARASSRSLVPWTFTSFPRLFHILLRLFHKSFGFMWTCVSPTTMISSALILILANIVIFVMYLQVHSCQEMYYTGKPGQFLQGNLTVPCIHVGIWAFCIIPGQHSWYVFLFWNFNFMCCFCCQY